MEKFDVLSIKLEGSNLIEASAGTGKTYSLAILALRLIVEKNIPIKQILMVTFTNAATAELEVRIRKFIRQAYSYIKNKQCDNDTIKRVIDQAIIGGCEESVKNLLLKAVNSLDESSVMTIHSFCQNTLSEFQFETGQLDRTEILTDLSDMVEFEVNEFWRKEISVLDISMLQNLEKYLDKDRFTNLIHKTLAGRNFLCSTKDRQGAYDSIKRNEDTLNLVNQEYVNHIENNFNEILARGNTNGSARNFLTNKCHNNAEDFIEEFKKINQGSGYVETCFHPELNLLKRIERATQELEKSNLDYSNVLFKDSIEIAILNIKRKMRKLNLVSFDELISTVHAALKNQKLITSLNSKYQAIFIDEFQDTDKLQYDIFNQVFDKQAVIFYIGDPKQSIYGFRNADINTYLFAREKIGESHCFSMNSNFRSTSGMVKAMNQFFKPSGEFDTFNSSDIVYHNVESTANQGELLYDGESIIPITVMAKKNKPEITLFVGNEILRLLSDKKFTIKERNGVVREIVTSDIAVLVRSGKEGKEIKDELARLGIPAVTIDDTKVMESKEGNLIKRILTTAVQPNRKNINSLLADNFFGYDLDFLQKLNDKILLELFTELKESWIQSGVYNMLSMFFKKFSIIEKCLQQDGTSGQRSLTNFYQLMEILHKEEILKQLNPEELYVWFDKATQINSSDDLYQQRIESDENAVTIMTIHKCKGLTFNIVFTPFLDFYKFPTKYGVEYRDTEGQCQFTYDIDSNITDLYELQTVQENKRLLYVALTRAVYKTYISTTSNPDTELAQFLIPYNNSESMEEVAELIEFNPEIEYRYTCYTSDNQITRAKSRDTNGIFAFANTWNLHSFSSLSHKHDTFSSEPLEIVDVYERFVFNEMPKGAKAGLFLHSIFEHLDFTQQNKYAEQIAESGKFYSTVYKDEHADLYLELVKHCMEVQIKNDDGEIFSLQQVEQAKKLPELEFYFSLDKHQKSRIADIIPEIDFTTNPEIEGMMHGFIDLFFENNGKYYILDWKSNFLGNSIQDYNKDGLLNGMKGNNYHLQYYIYTVAIKRYLKKKLPGFDYEKHFGGVIYLFLRGVRSNDNSTGVFFAKPSLQQIESIEELFLQA